MTKIDCIVYSKDRACQLDLLLRSTEAKFKNVGHLYVIYTHSSLEFDLGYQELILGSDQYNIPITFIPQQNFKEQVLEVIRGFATPFFLGLCDDDVFIRETDCSKIVEKLQEPDVSAISIKAGLNIHYNYPSIPTDYPEFIENGEFLKWEWGKCRPDIDWGYPTCINSFIFLNDYYVDLIKELRFISPPTIEAGLNSVRNWFKKYMVAFPETKLLNIPLNRVQTISPNAFGRKFGYSLPYLNAKFLEGKRINPSNIYAINPVQANEEVEVFFV